MIITKHIKSSSNVWGFIEVKPDNYDQNKTYPLVIHLHGTGGRNGLDSLIAGELPEQIQKAVDIYQFIALAPHTTGDWNNAETDHVLNYAKNLPINWNKVYLLGTSLGGGGVTRYISATLANAKKLAGFAAACGLNWLSTPKNIADAGLTGVMFHAADDTTVGPNATHQAISSINQYPMPVPVKKVIYSGGQHWIWNKVFHSTESPWMGNESPKTLWEYLLMLEVGKPVAVPMLTPDVAMVIDAGPDQTVTIPNIKLDGGRSRNYKSISWSIVSNPPGVNIWNVFPNGAGWFTVDAKLEKPGTYIFKLTGIDAAGAKIEDTVQVTYNSVPLPEPTPADKILYTIKTTVYESGKITSEKI